MKYTISLTLMLTTLWLLLSGHYQMLILSFGAVSVAFSLYLARRMNIIDAQSQPLFMLRRLPRYWLSLVYQIVVSNIEVAACILGLKKVQPQLTRVPFPKHDDLSKVIYANSITLTPGTATVHIENGSVLVHTLNAEGAKALQKGEMVDIMPFEKEQTDS